MAIGSVGLIGPIASFGPVGPVRPNGVDGAGAGGRVAESGNSFGSVLAEGVEKLQGLHTNADNLAVQAATGDLRDVHDYMLAASKASTATQLTVAVRNKALEAYSEIMRMPV